MSDRVESIFEEIREVKHILLPELNGELGALRYETWYKPHISGGGDYFDIVQLSDPGAGYGFMMADVSGHGAAAAMEAVMFDAILRTCKSYEIRGPADVLNYVNPHLFTKRLRGNFISAVIFNLNIEQSLIRYVNAGHPPAMAINSSGELILFDESSHIPLCIDPDHQYTESSFDANGLERFIFYTDGVIELKKENGQQLGIEAFKDIVVKSNCLIDIKSQVEEIVTEESLKTSDDITVLFVERTDN